MIESFTNFTKKLRCQFNDKGELMTSKVIELNAQKDARGMHLNINEIKNYRLVARGIRENNIQNHFNYGRNVL